MDAHRPAVLFITTSFPTRSNPGSGIFVYRLLNRLVPRITVRVLTPDTTPEDRLIEGDVELLKARYLPKRLQMLCHQHGGIPAALDANPANYLGLAALSMSLFVYCLREAGRTDVMHANWSLTGLVSGLAARLTGTRAVVTLRGADVNRAGGSSMTRLVLSAAIRLNHRVVCVSQSQLEWLVSAFPSARNKVTHIANGVNFPDSPRPDRESGQAFRLISVGSLIERKGQRTLIEALAALPEDLPATLSLVGAGPMHTELLALAEALGIAGRVSFLGDCPPDSIETLLLEHEAFALCSYSEGRSNALIEAMAASLPIIATSIPGNRELIDNDVNGLLVPCNDPQAVAEAIQRLYGNSDLRLGLGQAARQRLEGMQISWEHCADGYYSLYRRVMRPAAADTGNL